MFIYWKVLCKYCTQKTQFTANRVWQVTKLQNQKMIFEMICSFRNRSTEIKEKRFCVGVTELNSYQYSRLIPRHWLSLVLHDHVTFYSDSLRMDPNSCEGQKAVLLLYYVAKLVIGDLKYLFEKKIQNLSVLIPFDKLPRLVSLASCDGG